MLGGLGDLAFDCGEDFVFGGVVEVFVECDVCGVEMEKWGDEFGGGAGAEGGGGEEMVRFRDLEGLDLAGEPGANLWRGGLAAAIEGAIVVVEGGVGPG